MFKTRLLGLGVLLVGLGAASCASDNQPAQPPNVQPAKLPNSNPAQPSDAKPAQPRGYQSPVGSNQPVAPKDAQYTIYCFKVSSPDHVAMAEKLRKDLTAQTEFKHWHVIHQASESLLYYGFYKSIDEKKDKKEAERAQLDRTKIALMTDPMGNRPFARAMIVTLESPDPLAPPEWNLANAPGDYSLQIGTYKDSAQRKEAAIEAVREARKNGVEAYYYHGETQSLVCIGHWPKSALRKEISKPNNPNQEYMIAPESSDPRVIQQYEEMAKSKNVPLVQSKTIVVDPTLEAAIKQYPYNSINGDFVKRVQNGESAYVPSVVVDIPRDKNLAAAGSGAGGPAGAAAVKAAQDQIFQSQPRPLQSGTAAPPQPSSGALRGIGN